MDYDCEINLNRLCRKSCVFGRLNRLSQFCDNIDMLAFLKKIGRFVRRRAVLGLIFSLSLLYCVTNLFWPSGVMSGTDDSDSDNLVIPRPHKFQWHAGNPSNESDLVANDAPCKNSVQGKVLIADDRGFVCPRSSLLPNGCCDVKDSKRYNCETCQDNGCCNIYEYCISCCMQPDKKVLLQRILGKASETSNLLYASVTGHFELCLAKCRTSSQSVHHENSYRDPKAKHCYGEAAPAVHLMSS